MGEFLPSWKKKTALPPLWVPCACSQRIAPHLYHVVWKLKLLGPFQFLLLDSLFLLVGTWRIAESGMPFMACTCFSQLIFTSLHLSDGAYTFPIVPSAQEGFVPWSHGSEAKGEVFAVARVELAPTEISEKVPLSNHCCCCFCLGGDKEGASGGGGGYSTCISWAARLQNVRWLCLCPLALSLGTMSRCPHKPVQTMEGRPVMEESRFCTGVVWVACDVEHREGALCVGPPYPGAWMETPINFLRRVESNERPCSPWLSRTMENFNPLCPWNIGIFKILRQTSENSPDIFKVLFG